jgi:hypothetical protein
VTPHDPTIISGGVPVSLAETDIWLGIPPWMKSTISPWLVESQIFFWFILDQKTGLIWSNNLITLVAQQKNVLSDG